MPRRLPCRPGEPTDRFSYIEYGEIEVVKAYTDERLTTDCDLLDDEGVYTFRAGVNASRCVTTNYCPVSYYLRGMPCFRGAPCPGSERCGCLPIKCLFGAAS